MWRRDPRHQVLLSAGSHITQVIIAGDDMMSRSILVYRDRLCVQFSAGDQWHNLADVLPTICHHICLYKTYTVAKQWSWRRKTTRVLGSGGSAGRVGECRNGGGKALTSAFGNAVIDWQFLNKRCHLRTCQSNILLVMCTTMHAYTGQSGLAFPAWLLAR